MSLKSTTKTLFNSDGYEIAVKDGIGLSENSASLLIAGSDGTDIHYISLDEEGRKLIVGPGSSGSPSGGVVSAQGTAGESDEVKIMGHVDIDNFPADLSVVQDNAAELLASIGGLGAAGTAVVGNPVRLGAPEASTYGSVDNFTNNIRTDSSGRLEIAGPSDLGEAIAGAPVRIGASDGSLTTNIASDSAGRLVRVGAADAGSAVSGAPIRIGGSDGSLTTDILTDSAGRLIAAGAAGDNSAVAGSPVRLGASDGTNTQDILSDDAGRLVMVGAAAAGSAPSGNPVLAAGWDGTDVQIFKLDGNGAVQVNEVKSDTATIYDTSATTSSATLLSSNAAREGAIVYNDSNRFLYVKLGASASSSSFTARVAPFGQYLVPAGFTGEISGLWTDASAVGTARVTEFAPGGGGGGGGGGGIVSSGLVLHLDAGNGSSYPGSGNTWYDLSGNGNHATLTGTSYSGADGGSIDFGTGDNSSQQSKGEVTLNSSLRPAAITQSVWTKRSSGSGNCKLLHVQRYDYSTYSLSAQLWNDNPFIFEFHTQAGGNPGYAASGGGQYSSLQNDGTHTPQQALVDTWQQVTHVYDPNSLGYYHRIYVNGICAFQLQYWSGDLDYDMSVTNLLIGARHGSSPYLTKAGNMSIVAIYNRGLTEAEVVQNFNADCGRYGLSPI